jgi:hypothetical protein
VSDKYKQKEATSRTAGAIPKINSNEQKTPLPQRK